MLVDLCTTTSRLVDQVMKLRLLFFFIVWGFLIHHLNSSFSSWHTLRPKHLHSQWAMRLSNEAFLLRMRQETPHQAIRMVPIDNLAPPLPMQDGSVINLISLKLINVVFLGGGELQTLRKSGSTVSGNKTTGCLGLQIFAIGDYSTQLCWGSAVF